MYVSELNQRLLSEFTNSFVVPPVLGSFYSRDGPYVALFGLTTASGLFALRGESTGRGR